MNKVKTDNNVDVTVDNNRAIASNLNPNNNGNQISSEMENHSNASLQPNGCHDVILQATSNRYNNEKQQV